MRQTAACFVVLVLMLAARTNWAQTAPIQANGNGPRLDSVGDPLPPGALLRLGTVRFRYPSIVIELALSPDDKYVATIGREWLIVWEAETGRELWREDCAAANISLPGASYGIRGLAFSSDGKYLYTPGGSNQVLKWEAASGKRGTIDVGSGDLLQIVVPRMLLAGDDNPRSIDVTPDGGLLALGGGGGLVVCDPSGKVLYKRRNNPAKPVTVDDMNSDRLTFGGEYSYGLFSPRGDVVAAVLSEAPQEIVLLSGVDGSEIRKIPTTAKVVRMAYSPDGKKLVTTERDCGVRQYDVATGNLTWAEAIPPAPRAESYTAAVAYSSDGKTVAVCASIGADNAIYLLDATTGERRAKLEGHQWKPWGVAFSSDSRTLYSSGWDGVVRRWDVGTAKQLPLPVGTHHASGLAAASPTEPILAYEDDRGMIHFVSSDSGEELRTLSIPDISFTRAAFSQDGKLFAAGGISAKRVHVVVWDMASGEIAFRRDWDKGQDEHSEIDALEFSPNGRQLATAVFRQGGGHLWDLTTGDEVARLAHKEIFGLSFFSGGDTLVTVGWDSLIQQWDTETGLTRSVAMASDAGDPSEDWRICQVCCSPAGDLIATTHLGDRLVFWQADGMIPRGSKGSAGFSQQGVSFSPDGLWLATGLRGGEVVIWDPYAAEEVWRNDTHKYDPTNLQFVRGSLKLLTGANDGCCHLWDLRAAAPKGRQKPLEQLWNDLSSNGKQAFEAFLELIGRPQDAVPYLAERLQGINEVVDVENVDSSLAQNQAEAERPEKQLDVENRHDREGSLVVRRALSVLAEIGEPEAQQALQKLAKLKPGSDLSLMAADALARRSQMAE